MHLSSDSSSDSSAPAQATLKSWLAVLSVSLGAFVLVTAEFLPIGLLTNIARSLKVTDGMAGLMVSIPGIVAAFAAPVLPDVNCTSAPASIGISAARVAT